MLLIIFFIKILTIATHILHLHARLKMGWHQCLGQLGILSLVTSTWHERLINVPIESVAIVLLVKDLLLRVNIILLLNLLLLLVRALLWWATWKTLIKSSWSCLHFSLKVLISHLSNINVTFLCANYIFHSVLICKVHLDLRLILSTFFLF